MIALAWCRGTGDGLSLPQAYMLSAARFHVHSCADAELALSKHQEGFLTLRFPFL